MAKKIIEPELELPLGKALSYYHQEFSKDDAKDWLMSYCREKSPDSAKIVASIAKTNLVSTYGFAARLFSRGYEEPSLPTRIDAYLSTLTLSTDEDEETSVKKTPSKFDLNPFLEKIDHLVDSFLIGDKEFDINKEIQIYAVPVSCIPDIKRELKSYEFDVSQEGYSHIGTRKYQKLQSMLTILEKARKPTQKIVRKRKIDPHKMVSALNYLPTHEILGDSIHPVHIVGAKALLVFNVQKKTLSLFKSKDVSGLLVKGSSIANFNDKIITKQVKNPVPILDKLKNCNTLSEMVDTYSSIEGKESTLKSLINKYTLLIKVL